MPSKYRVKEYAEDTYYHVFNRGVEKRTIFKDDQDYAVFLNLLKRYLSDKPEKDKHGREYPHLNKVVQLNAFCLMPNHFHLLVFQLNPEGMTKLMQGVCTAYTMYFNRKYKRVGPLFQGRFKASRITEDVYLQHITRYIHLNPEDYKGWKYSSLPYYLGEKHAEWIRVDLIMGIFTGVGGYKNFLADYTEYRQILKEIKHELADQ
jgi:putative transposase